MKSDFVDRIKINEETKIALEGISKAYEYQKDK